MRAAGLIAEYNPFHNGHAYHIEETKRITDADYTVVIMSGDFVQRGCPAIVDKYARTQMALLGGADLVLELPVRYATGSAEYFASASISLLSALGIVDTVCFGSELGDIRILDSIGSFLSSESPEFSVSIRKYTSQGLPFPAAREKALQEYLCGAADLSVLSSPNNILGIEYCKAIHRQKADLKPVTIPRIGSDYHRQELCGTFSSASAIRQAICSDDAISLTEQIPEEPRKVLEAALKGGRTADINDYTLLLKYRLMSESPDTLTAYQDITEYLANRICSKRYHFHMYADLIDCLKTKDLTYSRISRSLLHILLNIKKIPAEDAPYTPYARVLGFRKSSDGLLKAIKHHGTIPLITKLADRASILCGDALAMLDEDIWCANVYENVMSYKAHCPFVHEISHPVVIIP